MAEKNSKSQLGGMINSLQVAEQEVKDVTRLISALMNTPQEDEDVDMYHCLLYTSPSPRDGLLSRMPSSA